jgi:hypothetical protein
MEARISSQKDGRSLLIKTSGTIDSWIDFTKQLYKEIKKYDCEVIVIDHMELEFPSYMIDYCDLVHFYAENLPFDIRLLKLAVVVDPKYKAIADFWETYCHNRGFRYKAFASMEDACAWIDQQWKQATQQTNASDG